MRYQDLQFICRHIQFSYFTCIYKKENYFVLGIRIYHEFAFLQRYTDSNFAISKPAQTKNDFNFPTSQEISFIFSFQQYLHT